MQITLYDTCNLRLTPYNVFHWQKILFSGAVIVSYLATGIACAVYASRWGKKPVLCAQLDDFLENEDDICDSTPLTVTNALEAVSIYPSMLS